MFVTACFLRKSDYYVNEKVDHEQNLEAETHRFVYWVSLSALVDATCCCVWKVYLIYIWSAHQPVDLP